MTGHNANKRFGGPASGVTAGVTNVKAQATGDGAYAQKPGEEPSSAPNSLYATRRNYRGQFMRVCQRHGMPQWKDLQMVIDGDWHCQLVYCWCEREDRA